MFPIAGPGATVDNKFTEGDPLAGVPATVVTAKFMNDVQAELLALLAAATPPILPSIGSQNQVLAAIQDLISDAVSGIGGLPRDFRSGFSLANNGAAPNTSIDVLPGAARDSTNAFDLKRAATFTGIAQTSGAWAAGNNQNKISSGVKANSTRYHVYEIRKTSDGTTDIIFDTSMSAPTLPSGFAGFRRTGSFFVDATGNIRQFKYRGNDRYDLVTPSPDVSISGSAGATTLGTLLGFVGGLAEVRLNVLVVGDGAVVSITPTDTTDQASGVLVGSYTGGIVANAAGGSATESGSCQIDTFPNSSSQLRLRTSSATGGNIDVKVMVVGWREVL